MLTLTLLVASWQQQELQRAAERIQMSQQASMMVTKAQHREVKSVQPESHLSPSEEAANHKAQLERLVTPR